MKEKIIEIIGFGMETERAELKANEIILLFNKRLIDIFAEDKSMDYLELVKKIYIDF